MFDEYDEAGHSTFSLRAARAADDVIWWLAYPGENGIAAEAIN